MHRRTGKVETVIVEYGFADSKKDDVKQIKKNWTKYAEAVVEAVCEYIVHKYTEHNQNKKVPEGKLYKVQVGAFKNRENAEKLVNELEKKGYKPFIKKE